MESKNLGLMIAAFVMIVIGASLIGIIATSTQTVTKPTQVVSERHALVANNPVLAINATYNYTVTNAPTGWKTLGCPLTNFVVKNVTGSPLTLTDDYTVDLARGTYTLVNTAATNTSFGKSDNSTYVDYGYCSDGYITESWGRTVLDLVPGFFALALMGIGVALFYGVMKSEGLLSI